MTLSRHSFLLKLGIATASCTLAGIIFIAGKILPFYPGLVDSAVKRAGLSFIFEYLPAPGPYAAFFSVILSIVYALVTLILLFYFFEKTQSIEAHFFMFYVFSFVFEVLRTVLPLHQLLALPGVYLVLGAHGLVFCRYFGIFSLFCASLYAAGLKTEKEEKIIFPLIIIALFISFRIPINHYTWDTSLCLVDGYPLTIKVLETVIALFTVLSFINGAVKQSIKEYYFVSAGSLLVILGRALLFASDTYILPAAGVLFLAAGTYLICAYLRKIYLWA